jgi:hypothetical protein
MSSPEKTKKEIEVLLRSLQARNEIPRYICYWANGSVTQGDECVPVLDAAKKRLVYSGQESEGLLAYLTPTGVFQPIAGVWWVPGGGCFICGNIGISYDYDVTPKGHCPYGCMGDMTEKEVCLISLV